MIGLVVIIVCIGLSVFCYKKMANRCRVKGRGTLTTFFISLSSSSLVFLVSMIIGVANFFPESESGKVSNVKEEKYIKKTVATVKIEKPIKQTQSSMYAQGNPYYDDTDFIEGWTNIVSLYGKGRIFVNVSGRYPISKVSLPSDEYDKQFHITFDKNEAVKHRKAVHAFQIMDDANRENNTKINIANIETKSGTYQYNYYFVNGKAWLGICLVSEPVNCGIIDKTNAFKLNEIFRVS